MTGYILKRTLQAIPIVLGASTLIFFLMQAAPGDATSIYIRPDIDPAVIEQMRKNLGLDQPVHVQYVRWLSSFARGDFGFSFSQKRPIIDIIKDTLPNTLLLSSVALVVIYIVGVLVGTIQAVRQYSWIDNLATIGAFFFYSMPSFWLGLLLIVLFAVRLQWLPAGGYVPFFEDPVDNLRHMLLPAIVLGTGLSAVVMRQMRSAMLDSLGADYVRTARAKGLSEFSVVGVHALRNSLITVVTIIGLQLGVLISGAIVTEQIFGIAGFGRLTIDAVNQRDYALLQGVVLVVAAGYVVVNLLVDLPYSFLNPRIRIVAAPA